MESHATVLGIVLLVVGILGLLGAGAVLVISVGVPLVVHSIPAVSMDAAVAFVAVVVTVVAGIIVLASAPCVIAGYGLVNGKPWAWGWGLIACALQLPGIPIGTAVGVYGLWVLTQPETREMLRGRAD